MREKERKGARGKDMLGYGRGERLGEGEREGETEEEEREK